MDLSIWMRTKYRHAICLKFAVLYLNFLIKLVFQAEVNISSAIKENLLLYCRKYSLFIIASNKVYLTRKRRL